MQNRLNDAELDERARRTMIENGLEPDLSADVRREVAILTDERESAAPSNDLRGLLWSSIDNKSSRDLDQVEYAERRENGDIRVLVGIADVDHLVKRGSAIDRHAAKNTVTVYTESEIFPLLPEELSTDLTSLNEGGDRAAIIVELLIKANGDVPGNRVFAGTVRNQAKLAYSETGAWLENSSPAPQKIDQTPALKEQILLQSEAAQRLHKFRREKGALEFESIESSPVVVDGEISDIESVRPDPAKKIIENFMIAANVEMAEFLEAHDSLSIRRIVRTPQRWDGIRRVAAEFGTTLPAEPDALALADFLAKRRSEDPLHYPDLSLSIIKLIGSGEYVVQRPGEVSSGHFGLAVRDYSHSTAPNRRFSDLVVQRLVKAKLNGEPDPYTEDELIAIAAHCNVQERAARKVERKMRKIVAANVMRRRIGQSFDAIVTGKSDRGTYARILRPPVDGRIVKGEDRVDVGEKIGVKLLGADPRTGFIDLGYSG